ncbi:MAG: thioredoxin domain-containing protein [Candidatus Palauibacterales bacterium]|nr:thioredoxin domain-containing protein [Candidatus Palauibacterales bacterium]MDP2529609.1 thioredoxin domain-containing protein [Candidatus Palauibacterales bacterium]MDP2582602.1 thioredoxin domain-containing protein [Candidatus Palauibacterales bacterium]
MPRRRLALLLFTLLPLVASACADKDGKAQTTPDGSVVPSDVSVIMQRADRARIMGDTSAPVRMIEVSDFECPFCKQYFDETYPKIDSAYVKTGKIQYLWISFPNPRHVHSWPAIEAGFCAGAVGKFWPMHDLLFRNQAEWTKSDTPVDFFMKYAEKLGIDSASYRQCLEEDRPSPLQVRDLASVTRVGVNGTPFFIIGDSISMEGAAPFAKFREVLDSLIAKRSGKAGPAKAGAGRAPADSGKGKTPGG